MTWPPTNGHRAPVPLPSGIEVRRLEGGETIDRGLFGEVVESSTTDFLAQTLTLDAAPPFGALVDVAADEDLRIYGIVAHVQTTGIDPGARAVMRGHGDVRDERIYLENPDLPLVLRTTFRAIVVGYGHGAPPTIHQFLPPRPPRLHYSVFVSPTHAVRDFADAGLDYLQALLTAPEMPVDELLAANLRYIARQQSDPAEFLQTAGRELAQLLRADYARLTAILRRCLAPATSA